MRNSMCIQLKRLFLVVDAYKAKKFNEFASEIVPTKTLWKRRRRNTLSISELSSTMKKQLLEWNLFTTVSHWKKNEEKFF